ncbi:MAG: AAA family ATPase, partial [Candidatus Omnitrophica bacterium]|nr:AAA family ATPase [Candidatus Omnitrophota bacterium]
QSYSQIFVSVLAPYKSRLQSLYETNHAKFISTYGTNITQLKVSAYDIRVVEEEAGKQVIQGVITGSSSKPASPSQAREQGSARASSLQETVIVQQPVLGPVDQEYLSSLKMILDPATKRDLIDLMFFTSGSRFTPVFLLGPTATGKTSQLRYLAALAGKPFLRVQVNSQTDELDLLGHFMPQGLSISYEEAVSLIQEQLDTNQLFKLQYTLSLLLPTEEQRNKAKSDPDFAKRQIESALYLKDTRIANGYNTNEDPCDLIRSIGHILLYGTSGVELTFKKAHFLESLERGDWILLDEINLAREESLGVLYGLLSRGYLDFDNRKIYPKQNNGMLFAAGNPSSDAGRNLFSEALENRFQVFYIPQMSSSQESAIIFDKYCDPKNAGIEGISLADIQSLVELNHTLDRLLQDYKFEGFDNERPYPFTIRNLENILKNTQTRLSQGDNTLTPSQALIKETFIEYRDILNRSDKNITLLKEHIKASFSQQVSIPSIDLSFNEQASTSLDGLTLPEPKDRSSQDKDYLLTEKDVDLILTDSTLDITRAILYGFRNQRRPVMLLGQTAAGKTETVANTARFLGWQYYSENLRDTQLSSLIGTWERNPKTGILSFADGILIKAMTKGYCLVLEEINFMDTGLLEVLSEWIDEGSFTNPKTHRKVAVHPDFRLFATLNPIQGNTRISLGRNTLPGPFINRFKLTWVNEKDPAEQARILEGILKREGIRTGDDLRGIKIFSKAVSGEKAGFYPSQSVNTILPISDTQYYTPRLSGNYIKQDSARTISDLYLTGRQQTGAYKDIKIKDEQTVPQTPKRKKQELSNEELSRLFSDMGKDPLKREKLNDKIKEFSSFFDRVADGKVKIRPGNNWAYDPRNETLIYPLQNILEIDREVLAAEGMHEGMHRYGTRYTDFLPFMGKLTNLLFNAAEDVTIENWAGYRVKGAPKYLEVKNRIMDSREWLEDHFGEGIPEHIKFIFGILYYGKHGELPDVLKGNARNELEKDEVKQPLDEVFNAIPKLRDENGNISVNTEPTPMEITAAAKKRVEIMRDEILPVYKKLLAERVEQLKNQQEGQDENGENV